MYQGSLFEALKSIHNFKPRTELYQPTNFSNFLIELGYKFDYSS